ncbi:MAG: hypothetical protein ACRD25_06675, partial [Terracidiphilus sp.]
MNGSYIPLTGASGSGRFGALRGALRFAIACAVAALAGLSTAAWFAQRGSHFEAAAAAASAAAFALLLSTALFAGRFVARDAARRQAPAELELPVGWTERLHQFTRSTLHMDLNEAPGRQLAELVHRIFNLEAVAVYDADLGKTYQAGLWHDDPQEMALNACHFESSDDDPQSGFHRRAVRLGTVPV